MQNPKAEECLAHLPTSKEVRWLQQTRGPVDEGRQGGQILQGLLSTVKMIMASTLWKWGAVTGF